MVVAGRGTAATSASSAQIPRPAISSSHRACCGMGWLDSGACWFGPGVFAVSMMPRPDRPVSADTPGGAPSSAPSPAVTRPIVPVPPPSARRLNWIRRKCHRRRQPLNLRRKDQNRQWRKGVHDTNRRELEKNPRIARSQTAAIPDAWSAHATAHDMAWWWLLTFRGACLQCSRHQVMMEPTLALVAVLIPDLAAEDMARGTVPLPQQGPPGPE